MKPASTGRFTWVGWLFLWILILWAAALTAHSFYPGQNILLLLEALNTAITNPFQIRWTDQTGRCLLIFSIAYALGTGIYYSTRRNQRPKEEHGCSTQIKAQRFNWNLFDENDGLSIYANVQTIL